MNRFFQALVVVTLMGAVQGLAQTIERVEAQALMKEAAMLRIDRQQRFLRVGERSPEGVLLVRATPREAVIELGGHRRTLTLSNRIAGDFSAPEQSEVQIPRNQYRQYLTTGELNDRRVLVLVDTGANSVAMNSNQARGLGIDYLRTGTPTMVGTAGGVVRGYNVVLDKVSVGGISASYVEATVIEGDFPAQVLLGMTYLRHISLREENGIMYLRQKY